MVGLSGSHNAAAALFAAAFFMLAPMTMAVRAAEPAAEPAAVPPKAQACVACHGPEGNSPTPAIPSLAAQPAQFIATQLLMFREGRRKDAQMSPFAAGLTNADLNSIAAYFSTQKLAPPTQTTDPAVAEAGARIAKQYNCTQGHGAVLQGQQHIPRLAGQQAEYLKVQLRGFKAGTRFDMDGQMTSAALPLTDADITALAEYMAGLN